MAIPPDLAAEQAYIDRAYERLEAMRRAAEDLRDSVIEASRGGTHQARIERDVFVERSLQRLEQLELGRSSLLFGRIDRDSDANDSDANDSGANDSGTGAPGNGASGNGAATNGEGTLGSRRATNGEALDPVERFYIGRLAVADERQEPLVVDWRAPVAEAFYRATGRSPMGLRRRRHFATEGRRLLAIEDELFRSDEEPSDDDLGLVGPGALLAALGRSRSGQMRDIVATVQREQDEIIRGELPGVLVVQGGPGTGKTAVALHRAAYLLYTYRFPLEQQGVLVIGPNQLFLRYIEQVLPSLGESGVALTTLVGLVPRIRPRHVDSPLADRVKGSGRMATVISRAVSDRERGLREDLVIGFGAVALRIPTGVTHGIVEAARRRPGTHNSRRRLVETLVLRALYDQYATAVARGRRTGMGGGTVGPGAEELDQAELGTHLRRDPSVAAALDRMWPVLTPEELLNDLFGSRALLALATRKVVSAAEREALARPRSADLGLIPWTAADLPLLDEARALLGPPRSRRARGTRDDPDEEMRAYGHIVVDEAQDVSPMGLRMLSRRSISGSMTLVGDIGQATSPAAPMGWDEVLEHLAPTRSSRVVTLTVNYRTPAEIAEVAAEVLHAAKVAGVVPPRSVRAIGRLPEVRSVAAPDTVAADVARAAASELTALCGGTVAVIAPASMHAGIGAALAAGGVEWGDPARTGLSAPVTVLDIPAAKGLEFDSVVVAEPAALADEPGGLRGLFVALTRPTRRLVIVHARPLPDSLARGLTRAAETARARSACASRPPSTPSFR